MDGEKPRNRTEFDDLQNELSGSGNKAARFFDGDHSPRNRHIAERKARDRAFQTQLELLLLNPEYAAAYNRVSALIDEAQKKLTAAVDKLTERIEHLEDVLGDMNDRAANQADGSSVFVSKDGNVCAADGRVLSDAEIALLTIPQNAPSWEAYRDAQEALNGTRTKQDKHSDTQTKIDDTRRKMDDPPSQNDLDDIEKDLKDVITELEVAEKATPIFGQAATGLDDSPLNDPTFKIDAIAP